MFKNRRTGLFLPTLNGAGQMGPLLAEVRASGDFFDAKLAIDSHSTDGTVEMLHGAGFTVDTIEKADFSHGRVRKTGMEKLETMDYVVMVTQDVQPSSGAFRTLAAFLDGHGRMISAYGRQLVDPKQGNLFEARLRLFNYPDKSLVKSADSVPKPGFKATFQSNAFAIYRRSFVMELGNFPGDIQFAEDRYMATQAMLHGYQVGYCAEAVVYHQHNYTLRQEYERFRNAGRFNRQYADMLSRFGAGEKEGMKYVMSELKYFATHGHLLLIPQFVILNAARFLGYKIGNGSTTN
ncbi:MAG: glycosyltransferase [Tannerella sp.]|jgi:rhamnosyltransferase|nr:glycosyltransferase [Tannerella sp.]